METNIYGDYGRYLPLILEDFSQRIQLKMIKLRLKQAINCTNISLVVLKRQIV